jgi:IS30 family transposase
MQTRRRGLCSNLRTELWQRWRAGQTLSDIARALGKSPGSIFSLVRTNGGFSPVPRRRRANALSSEDREEISRGLTRHESLRCIATRLGRAASTIAREVARNGGPDRYRAVDADAATWRRAVRPKACKLAGLRHLQRCVAVKLMQNWSPEQISAWLKKRYPTDERMRISHETIYRSLFIQARGVLKKELQAHLRTRRKMRHSKVSTTKGQPRGQIIDAISIRERPADVDDRAVPGHWEGDLISGSNNSHIATLVERHSRFVMLVKLDGKDAATVVAALTKHVLKLPVELRKSLTWDRGTELAKHKDFTIATGVNVYFCDPQSPWQRGSNENTNGLLRQYFPNGTDLSVHSQSELNRVARQLNERPRKTLGFETPAATLSAGVALTG